MFNVDFIKKPKVFHGVTYNSFIELYTEINSLLTPLELNYLSGGKMSREPFGTVG